MLLGSVDRREKVEGHPRALNVATRRMLEGIIDLLDVVLDLQDLPDVSVGLLRLGVVEVWAGSRFGGLAPHVRDGGLDGGDRRGSASKVDLGTSPGLGGTDVGFQGVQALRRHRDAALAYDEVEELRQPLRGFAGQPRHDRRFPQPQAEHALGVAAGLDEERGGQPVGLPQGCGDPRARVAQEGAALFGRSEAHLAYDVEGRLQLRLQHHEGVAAEHVGVAGRARRHRVVRDEAALQVGRQERVGFGVAQSVFGRGLIPHFGGRRVVLDRGALLAPHQHRREVGTVARLADVKSERPSLIDGQPAQHRVRRHGLAGGPRQGVLDRLPDSQARLGRGADRRVVALYCLREREQRRGEAGHAAIPPGHDDAGAGRVNHARCMVVPARPDNAVRRLNAAVERERDGKLGEGWKAGRVGEGGWQAARDGVREVYVLCRDVAPAAFRRRQ